MEFFQEITYYCARFLKGPRGLALGVVGSASSVLLLWFSWLDEVSVAARRVGAGSAAVGTGLVCVQSTPSVARPVNCSSAALVQGF